MAAPKQRRALTTQAVKVGSTKTGKLGRAGGAVSGRTQTGSRVGSTDAAVKSGSKAYGRSAPTTGTGGAKAGVGGAGGTAVTTPSNVVASTTYAGGTTVTPTGPAPFKPPVTTTVSSGPTGTRQQAVAATSTTSTKTVAVAPPKPKRKPAAKAKAVSSGRVAKVARKTPPKGIRPAKKKVVAKKLTSQQLARRFA